MNIYIGPPLKPQPQHTAEELARRSILPYSPTPRDRQPFNRAIVSNPSPPVSKPIKPDRKSHITLSDQLLALIRQQPGITLQDILNQGYNDNAISKLLRAEQIKYRVLRHKDTGTLTRQYAYHQADYPAVPPGCYVSRQSSP